MPTKKCYYFGKNEKELLEKIRRFYYYQLINLPELSESEKSNLEIKLKGKISSNQEVADIRKHLLGESTKNPGCADCSRKVMEYFFYIKSERYLQESRKNPTIKYSNFR